MIINLFLFTVDIGSRLLLLFVCLSRCHSLFVRRFFFLSPHLFFPILILVENWIQIKQNQTIIFPLRGRRRTKKYRRAGGKKPDGLYFFAATPPKNRGAFAPENRGGPFAQQPVVFCFPGPAPPKAAAGRREKPGLAVGQKPRAAVPNLASPAGKTPAPRGKHRRAGAWGSALRGYRTAAQSRRRLGKPPAPLVPRAGPHTIFGRAICG